MRAVPSSRVSPAVRRAAAALLLPAAVQACQPGPPPRSSPLPLASHVDAPPKERARDLVGLLEAGRFQEAAASFDAGLRATLSPAQLRDAWTTARSDAGAFVRLESATKDPTEGSSGLPASSRAARSW
jgi:hypothetical protein